MTLWFTEKQTKSFGITAKLTKGLHSEQTDFQKLDMIQTEEFGNMLVLDGMVMTTEKDEFVYHEMVVHVPLFTHPNPKKVLIVGGGDGGTMREVLKHPSVEKVIQVEIDQKVVEYSKQYLPQISCGYDNPRAELIIGDGFMHILNSENEYDVILVDSTEPVGPAANLFTKGFYAGIAKALKEDGIFVAQTDNPWFKADLIRNAVRDTREIFPVARLYTCNIPTYPSGMWTFTIGSKKYEPLQVETSRFFELDTKYYTPELHKASFCLPKFVEDLCK
ncbi:polyamine aminopropyltransferase [Domibacillus sp. DTU_2020_1001157_1_SI_ALB_TIR_016]|uniref:polyamine aminopropyltransferase n=1 Tax=Domibacillus sp. DTU_2020_1001157_1_SI_ALB_TIR_016 TaxID=3077789 RepID=UPI0028E64E60|nr:polyamine aminopropyltransferase [Domibacillus sp. DTU_2020_1001157_1_SI_ALB_TIR_016]WNS78719.1 polyamine aminopropyltransferase [Domibacillus sp. DTU_2020_1001157_1_SI_ALB_TIR_016]